MGGGEKPNDQATASVAVAGGTRGAAANVALLGARLYTGLTIAMAGFDKLPTPSWMVEQVRELRVFPDPRLFAFLASFSELVGGLLLAIGLFTRPAAAVLAVTLGVAAFGYHGVPPLVGMHIAQHFFWLFVVFLAIGPGRYSLDRLAGWEGDRSKEGGRPRGLRLAWSLLLAAGIAGFGLYREFMYEAAAEASMDVEIRAVNVAGTFNDWSLQADPMTRTGKTTWERMVGVKEAGPAEFKFTANGSWDASLGDVDQEADGMPVTGQGDARGPNIKIYLPWPGTYRFRLDTESLAYSIERAEQGAQEASR